MLSLCIAYDGKGTIVNSSTRQFLIKHNNFDNDFVNGRHTFFYDETNNIIKLQFKKTDSLTACLTDEFILGGLMVPYKSETELPCIDQLWDSWHLQKNMSEVKSNHILGKGDFFSSLTDSSKRLNNLLSWILENNYLLHFYSVNLFYFSLVDIVDSFYEHPVFSKCEHIKSLIWKLFLDQEKEGQLLLFRLNYPNLNEQTCSQFFNELEVLTNKSTLSKAECTEILEFCDIAIRELEFEDEIPIFLTGNEDKILVEELGSFFINPITLFKNSNHILDHQDSVETLLAKSKKVFSEMGEYSFQDSKNSKSIQVSDICIGLLGRFFKYINTMNSLDDFISTFQKLSSNQRENLKLFSIIVQKSMYEHKSLVIRSDAMEQKHLFEESLRFILSKG